MVGGFADLNGFLVHNRAACPQAISALLRALIDAYDRTCGRTVSAGISAGRVDSGAVSAAVAV